MFKGDPKAGYAAICLGDKVISSPIKEIPPADPNSLRNGRSEIVREYVSDSPYLSAAKPIRDLTGTVIGSIKLSTPEGPVNAIIYKLVFTFLLVVVLGAMCMATIMHTTSSCGSTIRWNRC